MRNDRRIFLAAIVGLLAVGRVVAEDDVSDLIGGAKGVTTAPAEVTGPGRDLPDALGTMKGKMPAGSREGTIVLNGGQKVEGAIWTTVETPLRVWVEETKSYMDLDLGLISRVDVHVISEGMEDDWRWLKEGSDQKIFSGKKYPLVELAYVFTLVNGQKVEGGVVAPIYVMEKVTGKKRALALYKKYKGKLDETMGDVVYIKTIALTPVDAAQGAAPSQSAKLPLVY